MRYTTRPQNQQISYEYHLTKFNYETFKIHISLVIFPIKHKLSYAFEQLHSLFTSLFESCRTWSVLKMFFKTELFMDDGQSVKQAKLSCLLLRNTPPVVDLTLFLRYILMSLTLN